MGDVPRVAVLAGLGAGSVSLLIFGFVVWLEFDLRWRRRR